MNVIPVINCPDVSCVQKKIEIVKTFLKPGALLHLDVTDGVFSTHKTWGDPFAWAKIGSAFPLEVHLMVEQPEDHADDWLTAGARRLVVHIETVTGGSLSRLIALADQHHGEIMLSLLPDTEADEMDRLMQRFEGRIAGFQVLAVPPGAAGQRFIPAVLEKITAFRRAMPDAIIEVDGGMDPATARFVKAAGADTIVSSNYIFGSGDPKKAFEALEAI